MNVTLNYSWPDTIPLPLMEAMGQKRNATLVGPVEFVSLKRRARMQKSYVTLNVQWALLRSEYYIFKTFFNDTLGNGCAVFQIELLYPKTSELTFWAVQFGENFRATFDDGIYKVESMLDLLYPIELS